MSWRSVITTACASTAPPGDSLTSVAQAWTLAEGAPVALDDQIYNSYACGGVTLLIDTDLIQTIP